MGASWSKSWVQPQCARQFCITLYSFLSSWGADSSAHYYRSEVPEDAWSIDGSAGNWTGKHHYYHISRRPKQRFINHERSISRLPCWGGLLYISVWQPSSCTMMLDDQTTFHGLCSCGIEALNTSEHNLLWDHLHLGLRLALSDL